jgi:H/ACA ribonucleoprotein complex subunit 3
MYLMYYTDADDKRVYTLNVRCKGQSLPFSLLPCMHAAILAAKASGAHPFSVPALPDPQKTAPDGTPTQSAHPAPFTPDDKLSRAPVTSHKRVKQLPTPQAAHEY